MDQVLHSFRLAAPHGFGVVCGADDGVRIGDVDLLERAGGRTGPWTLRDLTLLGAQLSDQYGLPVDLERKAAALRKVVAALNDGDIAWAQMTVLYMQFPDPPSLAKGVALTTADLAVLAVRLADARLLKADWNPSAHPRWPAGSPDSVGGQFAPAGSRGGAGGPETRPSQDARLIPAQVTIPMPLPWDAPGEMPFSPEILPFQPILPPVTRNPYPDRPECVKEWEDAIKRCDDLDRRGLLGKHPYIGHGDSFWQCVRGQVSEDCGGAPVVVT